MADYDAPVVAGQVQLSPAASVLLTQSGAMNARAFLLDEDGVGRTELPLVLGGSVSLDSGSTVRRSATLTILGQWSDSPFSRLTPYGTRVLVQRGIRVDPQSVEWVSLMVGRITEVSQKSEDNDAAMSLSIKDDFATIAADRFDSSTTTDTAKTVVENIAAYVRRSLPNARIVDMTGDQTQAGKIDVQQDPAGGIDKLATSISAEAYMGRDGVVVIRPQPSLDDAVRWQLGVGDAGNLITVERKRTADNIYNRVYVSGQDNGGTTTDQPAAPIPSGEAVINDPADPLYYGGPMGQRTRFYKSALIKSNGQAAATAASILEKVRGANVEFTFTALVNPAIDPGDVIESTISDGKRRVHIVDSINIPLGPTDPQNITVRSLELPAEQDSAQAAA